MTKVDGLNTHENSLPLQAQEDLALVQQGMPKNQTQDKITQQHRKTNKLEQLLLPVTSQCSLGLDQSVDSSPMKNKQIRIIN